MKHIPLKYWIFITEERKKKFDIRLEFNNMNPEYGKYKQLEQTLFTNDVIVWSKRSRTRYIFSRFLLPSLRMWRVHTRLSFNVNT